ncbi:MAG: hypothetical protein HUJ79_03265, partial [Firmicutes bacterium]|nr:hypothetical protein [Bacillota bacterium]
LVYGGASLLGLVLIPNKVALVPYIFCFGYYAILKYFIEKINSGVIQIALKAIYFAAVVCIGLLLFKSVVASGIHLPDYPTAILIVAGIIMMLLYDFVLTFLISWYMNRFKGGSANLKLS